MNRKVGKMNIKVIILISLLCVVLILVAFFVRIVFFSVIYPIRSSYGELTLVLHGGFHPNSPTVTFRHYEEGQYISSYVLVIENGIRIQEPQTYRLPELADGTVEVTINLGEDVNSSISIANLHARDLYEAGLLIYLYTNFNDCIIIDGVYFCNRYIHFITGRYRTTFFLSGEDRANYLRNGHSLEWSIVTNAPRLRRLPDYTAPFLVQYSGWRENEWTKH